MSKTLKVLIFGILLFSFQTPANAQNKVTVQSKDQNVIVVGATKTLKVAGQVTFIIVKETAKIVWETTKFTAAELAAPTAKALLLKAAPKITVFLLKTSGKIIEKAAPIALKMAITAAL